MLWPIGGRDYPPHQMACSPRARHYLRTRQPTGRPNSRAVRECTPLLPFPTSTGQPLLVRGWGLAHNVQDRCFRSLAYHCHPRPCPWSDERTRPLSSVSQRPRLSPPVAWPPAAIPSAFPDMCQHSSVASSLVLPMAKHGLMCEPERATATTSMDCSRLHIRGNRRQMRWWCFRDRHLSAMLTFGFH